jgi:hypothetical protein
MEAEQDKNSPFLPAIDYSDDDEEIVDGDHLSAESDSEWKKEYPGFSRNPLLVIVYHDLDYSAPLISVLGNCALY